MEQMKKVFSPGSTKDDELMYGSEQSRLQNAADNGAKKDTSTLYPAEGQTGQEKESGGVLRQITNPDGKKYDEQAMGTTATTEKPDPSKLQTDAEHKDQGILKQLTNPGRKGYDETAHGTTATTSGSASNDQTSLPVRDTTNTSATSNSGSGRDAAIAGGGAAAAAAGAGGVAAHEHNKRDNNITGAGQTDGLADGRTGTQAAQDQSGAHGAGRDVGNASVVDRTHDNDPYKGETILAGTGTTSQSRHLGDSNLASSSAAGYSQPSTTSTSGGLAGTGSSRTGGITDSSDQTFSSGQTGSGSHLGRDAGVAGGLAAAGIGAGAYGARDNNQGSLTSTSGAGTSQPLGQQSDSLTSGTTHGHINPVGAPEASLGETGGLSGPAHAGVLGASQHNSGIAPGGVHNNEGITQLNQAPADVQGATFLDRSFYVGKPGDSVSHGPNVPGQFPAAASEASTTGLSSLQTPSGSAQHAGSGVQQTATTSDHTSRNAALAGGALGAGALGTGAYAASRDHASATAGQSGISQTETSTAPTASGISQTTATSGVAQDPALAHYGRDSSSPATAGLGSSSVAQPSTTATQPTTSTTHSSTTPRSDVVQTGVPATARDLRQDTTRDDHHHRDAAVVGGVGAAGAGAYIATRDHGEPGNTTHDAYGIEDPNKHNKLHKQSPDEKKLEKEYSKEEKHHQKELERQQHEAQKQHEKQQHEAQKQHEKDAKERQHAAEKAEKKHEKELEKQHEKEEKDKKPSLIDRILHRHKDDDEKDDSYNKDEKAGEPLHIKENTNNGPLDHPLVIAAGTSTAAGAAGTSAYESSHQHGTGAGSNEPLGLKNNTDKGPLDQPLVTAAGTSTAAGAGGAPAHHAGHQHGTGSDLTGQQQGDVQPHLSGNNSTIGSSTTSATTAGGVGAAIGSSGAHVTPAAYQQGGHNTSDLTGQRQQDAGARLSGNNNAIGSSTTSTSAAVAGGALAAGGVAGAQHHHNQGSTSGSNIVNEPRTGLPMDLSKGPGAGGTDGNSHIDGYHQPQSTGTTSQAGITGSSTTGSGLTGRRQDDVDPYISHSK